MYHLLFGQKNIMLLVDLKLAVTLEPLNKWKL